MGYVKSEEEVAAIRSMLSPAYFVVEGIEVDFSTKKDFVRSVLPPCFDVPDEPRGTARVARWQSGVVGEFESTAVEVDAMFDDTLGTYFLTLLISGDMPVTVGREMWAEPKKRGHSAFYRDGDDVYAYGQRRGVRIVELEGTFGDDLGPREVRGTAFELQAAMSEDGGLLGNPSVLAIDVRGSYTSVREGTGSVTLTGSPWDPVHEVPVVNVLTVTHFTGESTSAVRSRHELDSRDEYLPYVLGRHFDDLTLFPRPRRHAALLER